MYANQTLISKINIKHIKSSAKCFCVLMKILSDAVSLKRFGYLDRGSNFKLVYESGESDTTLYPGTLICTPVYTMYLIQLLCKCDEA